MLDKIRNARRIYTDNGADVLLDEAIFWTRNAWDTHVRSRVAGIEPVERYLYEKSLDVLSRRMNAEENLEDVLTTAYEYTGYGPYRKIAPLQHRRELRELLQHIDDRNPETVAEIGTFDGGTLYLWTRYFESAQVFVSVDVDYGDSMRLKFYREFTERQLHFIERESQSECTVNRVSTITDEKLDFLFIDGDHSYEGAKRDFELYRPLMSDDGVIALHDIRTTESTGVPELWDEIRAEYATSEIFHTSDFDCGPHISKRGKENLRSNAGIGLVYLDE